MTAPSPTDPEAQATTPDARKRVSTTASLIGERIRAASTPPAAPLDVEAMLRLATEAKERAEKTPPEWELRAVNKFQVVQRGRGMMADCWSRRVADFVAAARQDVPALADAVLVLTAATAAMAKERDGLNICVVEFRSQLYEAHATIAARDAELIEAGKGCVVWITGDPDDAADVTTTDIAWKAINEALRLGMERNNERNALAAVLDAARKALAYDEKVAASILGRTSTAEFPMRGEKEALQNIAARTAQQPGNEAEGK